MSKKRLLLFSCGQLDILHQLTHELFDDTPAKMKTVCITTAANVYEGGAPEWQKDEMAIFEKFGLQLDRFDLEGKTPQETEDKLKNADIIYVTGGNTYFLLEQIQKTNFSAIVKQRLEDGALYIGCSAGSVIACPKIDYIREMDDPSVASLSDYTGMNLTDFYVLPHIDHEKYGSIAKSIAQNFQKPDQVILGLKDSQAIYLNGKYAEVIG